MQPLVQTSQKENASIIIGSLKSKAEAEFFFSSFLK